MLDSRIRGRYEKLVQIQQQQQQQKQKGVATHAGAMQASIPPWKQAVEAHPGGDRIASGKATAPRGLTSYDAVRWLSSQSSAAREAGGGDADAKPAAVDAAKPPTAGGSGNGSLLMAGAAAALAATSSGSGLGGLFSAMLSPATATAAAASEPENTPLLGTYSQLVFLRAIFRIVFRVIVLVRVARFHNSATPLSSLVLGELLR